MNTSIYQYKLPTKLTYTFPDYISYVFSANMETTFQFMVEEGQTEHSHYVFIDDQSFLWNAIWIDKIQWYITQGLNFARVVLINSAVKRRYTTIKKCVINQWP